MFKFQIENIHRLCGFCFFKIDIQGKREEAQQTIVFVNVKS